MAWATASDLLLFDLVGSNADVGLGCPHVLCFVSNSFTSYASNGSGVKLKSKLQTWTINLVERFKSFLSADDGFLTEGINSDNQLQYTNLYCPQNLKDGNINN